MIAGLEVEWSKELQWKIENSRPVREMFGMPIPGAPEPDDSPCRIVDGVLVDWSGDAYEMIEDDRISEYAPGELSVVHYQEHVEPPGSGETITVFYRPLDIDLPDGITAIYDRVFERRAMRSVRVPEGVTVIGNYAFFDCPDLREVILPSTLREIGMCAFANCPALRELNLPAGVTVCSEAFLNSPGLLDDDGFLIRSGCVYVYDPKEPPETLVIPDGVERIARYAFQGLSGKEPGKAGAAKALRLPESLRVLDSGVFLGFAGLQDENGFVIVRGTLFDYCGPSPIVHIPETVHTISEDALWRCRYWLQSEGAETPREIWLPSGLTEVCFSAIEPDNPELRLIVPEQIGAEKLFAMLDALSYEDEPFETLVTAPHVPPRGRYAKSLAVGYVAACAAGQLSGADLPDDYFDYFADYPRLLDPASPWYAAFQAILEEAGIVPDEDE